MLRTNLVRIMRTKQVVQPHAQKRYSLETETEEAGQSGKLFNMVADRGASKYDGTDTVKERESGVLSWRLVVAKYCHSLWTLE